LSPGRVYYWRVNANNVSGTSPWSAVWSFRTAGGGGGLAAPVLISPSDGATGVSLSPTLMWNASSGATSYLREVATDSFFVSMVLSDTITSTSGLVNGLSNSMVYYWRVKAANGAGSSAWSTVWDFTTVGSGGLSAPVLVSPVNGDTGVSLNPTLVWGSVSGATRYEVQVSTDASFGSIFFADTVTGVTDGLSGLSGGTQYYWRVNAGNVSGTSPWSAVWSFRTIFNVPGTPVLVSPADGDSGVTITPTLVWNASSGATSYILEVATDSACSLIVFIDTFSSTSRAIGPLAYSTQYYWRVRAANGTVVSSWSSIWGFTTAPSSFVMHYPPEMLRNGMKPVTVYDLSGRVISRSATMDYRTMTNGFYIYKTGDQAKKSVSLRKNQR
jgi:hypothetical protein